jgi:hypothetical protein
MSTNKKRGYKINNVVTSKTKIIIAADTRATI